MSEREQPKRPARKRPDFLDVVARFCQPCQRDIMTRIRREKMNRAVNRAIRLGSRKP